MCLGVCFLGSNFFGTLWASWTSWKSISFARLGKFSIAFSNKFSISCPSSSFSGTSMIRILEHLKLSWRCLSLLNFWILVSSFCSGWMFISRPSHWFESRFPSCHCWFPVHFLLFQLVYTSFFHIICDHIQNSTSERLALSLSLIWIFSEALICSFNLGLFFGLNMPVT